MIVYVNGERRELPAQATVSSVLELLSSEGDSPAAASRGLAVALDDEVVPRSRWSATPIAEGARIEVLAAIQGGSTP
jgi:sulfur carrier protein